ncbi:MAG: hypothetical protein L3J67_11260 [Hyphomicrobiaceae bacterium]|nr:hypothetical protein [Hyphomicrobiaceae bacterium]
MMMDQLIAQTQMIEAPLNLEHPQQAEDLCNRVLQTSAELIGVLERETEHLRKGDTQSINSLIARKTSLSTTMMKDMTTVNANASYISEVVPQQIELLKDQHAQFQRSLRVNQDALGAVKAISENLLRTISNAAGSTRSGPETYGRSAAMATNAAARPTAVSVNRTL